MNPTIGSGSPARGRRGQGRATRAGALLLAAGVCAPAALGNDNPVTLQWFELKWSDMEYRAPDFFMAGYGALWLPSAAKGAASGSAGYDVWNLFDLGQPGSPTTYGTENDYRAVLAELRRANGLVYVETIMNHCSTRETGASFQAAGGYPGYWMAPDDPPTNKDPTDDWGDFHNGTASGYYQSHDPGGARYDLHRGDLVGLIDIAQESNNQFIRQPVEEGDPLNIPAGTVYNRPNAGNYRFYPDRDLPGFTFWNPGAHGHAAQQFTIYPFNTADPMQGDPVPDNTTGMLMRWTQWMCDEFRVDGFRLDAAKHIPNWFWDMYWDSAVYLRRTAPSGAITTPFSFVESVESNGYTYGNYVRKDGFGNRDALDLNGAGQLRDLLNGAGLGSWLNVLNAHIDTADDGFNNGTLGVNHVFSHDNGSVGDGGSAPANPTLRQQGVPQHAYLLMRTGRAIVYHNARGVTRGGGFWPRQGVTLALGLDVATGSLDDTFTNLVQLHTFYGRGEFNVLNGTDPVNTSLDDVIVFERRTPTGGGTYSGNVLVACNDRYDSGVQQRNVLTSFAPGMRLHEMTGNAADPIVDPGGAIPEVLTVGADKRVLVTVPNNRSSAGEHHKGFVVYGPAVPGGVLEFTGVTGTIAADPPAAPSHRRRLYAVPVIDAETFEIRLTTSQTDTLDPNTDDAALFRIDQGFADFNGNGAVDEGASSTVTPGYEQFLTLNEPMYGTTRTNGRYHQAIDAADLGEGFHYVSVVAFRHRNANEAPLFREWRQAIYVDRTGPAVEWADAGTVIEDDSYLVRVNLLDRTATRVHVMWDLPEGADPVAEADFANQGTRHDRFEWRKTIDLVTHGTHRLTLVAFEHSGRASVTDYTVFADLCRVDFNGDGVVNTLDFIAYLNAFNAGDASADFTGDGTVNTLDFILFLNEFSVGC